MGFFCFAFWVVFCHSSCTQQLTVALMVMGSPKISNSSRSLFLLESQQHWGQTQGEGAETTPPLSLSIPRGFGRCHPRVTISQLISQVLFKETRLCKRGAMGIALILQKASNPLCSPGPISQNSSLSLKLPLGNARWKSQGCAQDISTNLLLEKKNHFELCGVSPSRKNYV